jgi:hypothetical protein
MRRRITQASERFSKLVEKYPEILRVLLLAVGYVIAVLTYAYGMLLYHGWPATIAYLPNFFSDLLYNSSVLYLLFISSGAVTLCVMAVIAFVIHRPLNRQFQNSVGLSRTGRRVYSRKSLSASC